MTRRRRTYKQDRVQTTAFGLAGPEQGELELGPAAPRDEPPPKLCACCGDELRRHSGYLCDRCRAAGYEPGTFDPYA